MAGRSDIQSILAGDVGLISIAHAYGRRLDRPEASPGLRGSFYFYLFEKFVGGLK
jgi:hypothetical protein